MNVVKSKSSRLTSLPKAETQPAKFNLYQEIPNIEVSLDDFEEFALDRLKVRIDLISPFSSPEMIDSSYFIR